MTKTTTGTLASTLSWNVTDNQDNGNRITDIASVGLDFTYTNGTGTGQVNQLWTTTTNMPIGGTTVLDLFNLSRNIFDGVLVSSFGTGVIQTVIVQNNSDNSGSVVSITASGANAWTNPFNGGVGNIPVPALSSIQLNNVLTGFRVSGSQRYLQLVDNGHGANISIALIGRTGV